MAEFDFNDLHGTFEKMAAEAADTNREMSVTLVSLFKLIKEFSESVTTERNVDSTTIDKIVTAINKGLKQHVGGTKASEEIIKGIGDRLKVQANQEGKGTLELMRVLEQLSKTIEALWVKSREVEAGGEGETYFKPSNQKIAKEIDTETLTKINKTNEKFGDRLQQFISNYFDEDDKKKGRRSQSIAKQIVEGIIRSKWIGGAFTDLIRGIGVLIASGVRKLLGGLGPILAPIVYGLGAMLGPILLTALTALGGRVAGGLAMRVLGRSVARTAASGGFLSKIAGFFSKAKGATQAGRTVLMTSRGALGATPALIKTTEEAALKGGGKVLGKSLGMTALKKVAGKALLPVGIGMDAYEAVDSFKQGNKGAGALFTMAALAPLIGMAVGGPVGLAIGSGVGLLLSFLGTWKKETDNNSKSSIDVQKDTLEEIKKKEEGSWWSNLFSTPEQRVQEVMETEQGKKRRGIVPVSPLGATGSKEGWIDLGGLKIDAVTGGILNARQFTKKELTSRLRAYKNDPVLGRLYESAFTELDYMHSDPSSFKTDVPIAYKGADKDLDEFRKALAKQIGLTKGSGATITSSLGTYGGPHTPSKSGTGKDHYNPLAMGIDIGSVGTNWTRNDWVSAFKVAKDFYGKKGFDVTLESGNAIYTSPDQVPAKLGSNTHLDLKKTTYATGRNRAVMDAARAGLPATVTDTDTGSVTPKQETTKRRTSADFIKEEEDRIRSLRSQSNLSEIEVQEKTAEMAKDNDNKISTIASALDPAGNQTYSRLQQTISNYVNIGTENVFC